MWNALEIIGSLRSLVKWGGSVLKLDELESKHDMALPKY